jgi:hypothetical protein
VITWEAFLTQTKYFIPCPYCDLTLFLLESSLAEIVQSRIAPTTGAPSLTLLCPACKHAYQFDYQNRRSWRAAILSEEQYQNIERAFSFIAGCGHSNCESQVELIALCDPGATKEQLWAEIPFWNTEGVYCKRGHPILIAMPSVAEELNCPSVTCHAAMEV